MEVSCARRVIPTFQPVRKLRCASVERKTCQSPDFDVFIDVELNKNNFSLRSFAMGGMPYFETSSLSYDDPANAQFLEKMIAGRVSPLVYDLFEGVDIARRPIPCFVTDSRQSITAKYQLVLSDAPLKSSKFKVVHMRKMSDSNDLLDGQDGVSYPVIPTRRKSKKEISKKSI